jgi:uncharacterized LabA/DUF88 family protein
MNIAYIDGQNLMLGVKSEKWTIDLERFRVYLLEKYGVGEAYYFIGQWLKEKESLYSKIEETGYKLEFKLHPKGSKSKKKGNIDTDLVFEAMRGFVERDKSDKFIIVSGDGDYRKVIDYLIKNDRFLKLLVPNGRYSYLYRDIKRRFISNISSPAIKPKLTYKDKESPKEK